MIRYFIHNGIAVAVLCITMVLFGFLSLFTMPVQLIPDVTTPAITVRTVYPGATPQDVEQEILIEQEEFLRGLPNLKKMTSSASFSVAEITLEFSVGSSKEENLILVNNALAQVSSYPENVDEPALSTSSASDQPVAWFSIRALPGSDVEPAELWDYADDNVKTRFERIPGVASVMGVFGGDAKQMQVYIDPIKLADRGISIAAVRNAIRDRNRDVSGGSLEEGKRRYNVRTLGRYDDAAEVENTIVSIQDGTPVYLRDIGYARVGQGERSSLIRHNGEKALAFGVRREAGSNLLDLMEVVKATVDDLNENALQEKGLYITQVTDDTEYVVDALAMVRTNLIIGGILAFFTLLIFLRHIRSTLVLGLAIPITLMGSFFLLSMAGRTINVISLAGLAFSIGAILDASIVVLENIYRHRTMPKESFAAAYDGTREVWTAIFSSVLTNVVVFAPILTLQDEAGQIFRDLAFAIIFANALALIISILVIPCLSAHLLRHIPEHPDHGLKGAAFNLFGLLPAAIWVYNEIEKILHWLMNGFVRRLAAVGIVIGLAALLIFVLLPKTEYLPEGNQNSIFGMIIPPQGYNLDVMESIGDKLHERFQPYVDASVEDYEAGRIDAPPIKDFFFVAFGSNMFVFTRAKDANLAGEVPALITRQVGQVPGVIPFATQRSLFANDIAGSRGIDVDILGTDVPTLTFIALQAYLKTSEVLPGAQPRPDPGIEVGQPQLVIRPKWERAAELDVSATAIGYGAWVLGDGAYADDYFARGDKMDLYIYSTLGALETLANFDSLRVVTGTGDAVPISTIASVDFTFVPEQIRRVDQRRAVTVQIVPPTDISLEEAIDKIENELIGGLKEEGAVPPGYEVRIGGSTDKLTKIREKLSQDFLLAIVLVYLTLTLIFKHWGYPLVIIFAVPIGLTGGVIGLKLLNLYLGVVSPGSIQSLDVLTMLGFVILLGSIVNNPILIVEQSLNFMREGRERHEAIVHATMTRIRPVLMTTFTTTFALLPLILTPGAGSELYRGLGMVMFGGLMLAAFVMLLFIPALLSIVFDVTEWMYGNFGQYLPHSKGFTHYQAEGDEETDDDKAESRDW
ncbi:efflux RND transporter permease subunit [bacterium]|nr:efflux RND transporter permease subunit [bacterium]